MCFRAYSADLTASQTPRRWVGFDGKVLRGSCVSLVHVLSQPRNADGTGRVRFGLAQQGLAQPTDLAWVAR